MKFHLPLLRWSFLRSQNTGWPEDHPSGKCSDFFFKNQRKTQSPMDPTSIYRKKTYVCFDEGNQENILGKKTTTTPNSHGISTLRILWGFSSTHGIRLDKKNPTDLDVLFIQGKHFGFDPDLGAAKRPSRPMFGEVTCWGELGAPS